MKSIQSIQFHFVWLLPTLMLLAFSTNCQEVSRNDRGEVIVTYSDGSWRYFTQSDSILLVEELEAFVKAERQPDVKVESQSNPTDNESIKQASDIQTDDISAKQIKENEEKILRLTERRLTLTERLRRVNSGYLQLSEKEIRKVNEELRLLNAELNELSGQPELIDDQPPIVSTPKKYNRNDYVFSPSTKSTKSECDVMVELDQLTGEKIFSIGEKFFFRYTPEELVEYLNGEPFIEAFIELVRSEQLTTILIHVNINSRKTLGEYGGLGQNSQLKVVLLNGDIVSLYNATADSGRQMESGNKFEFTGKYALEEDAVKKLSKHEIDKINIEWLAGNEEYEVYQVDLLKIQLKCLAQTD